MASAVQDRARSAERPEHENRDCDRRRKRRRSPRDRRANNSSRERAVPPKRVFRREPDSPSNGTDASPRSNSSDVSTGAVGKRRIGWQTSVGSISTSLGCGLARARTKRVSSQKEAAERGKGAALWREGERVRAWQPRGNTSDACYVAIAAQAVRAPDTTEGALGTESGCL